MKKWLCVLSLVLAISVPFSTVCADEDMAIYKETVQYWKDFFCTSSTDTLLDIRSMIDMELASREGLDKEVIVPAGIYTVGVDIPVGTYTIKGQKDNTYSSVEICDTSGNYLLNEFLISDAQLGRVDLQWGYIIRIAHDPVIFAKYKGLGF